MIHCLCRSRIVASSSAVVLTEIHGTCSVERIQETIERDVVLQVGVSSSIRDDGPRTDEVLGSGKVQSFFGDPQLFPSLEISTVRHDGLKEFESSECSSEVGHLSREGPLYDDVSSSQGSDLEARTK